MRIEHFGLAANRGAFTYNYSINSTHAIRRISPTISVKSATISRHRRKLLHIWCKTAYISELSDVQQIAPNSTTVGGKAIFTTTHYRCHIGTTLRRHPCPVPRV